MREKLIELPRQLRYCAADKDCRNCERRNVSCGSRYCVDDLMLKAAELLESIANGVTIQRWIPVSERLPDIDLPCLCYKESHGMDVYSLGKYLGAMLSENCAAFKSMSHYGVIGATHWMPLPQPPKEGE